jgi:hypothetical protein
MQAAKQRMKELADLSVEQLQVALEKLSLTK